MKWGAGVDRVEADDGVNPFFIFFGNFNRFSGSIDLRADIDYPSVVLERALDNLFAVSIKGIKINMLMDVDVLGNHKNYSDFLKAKI